MANEQNLIPITERAENVQREMRSKGGKARAKKIKAIKSFREAAEWALNMQVSANVNGEQQQITQYQRIMLTLLSYLNDAENTKVFMQAAQMLAQFRNSGYAEEKMLAEVEKLKAETKRISGDDKQDNNGKLSELIKGLQDDLYAETVAANEAVATEQAETPEST